MYYSQNQVQAPSCRLSQVPISRLYSCRHTNTVLEQEGDDRVGVDDVVHDAPPRGAEEQAADQDEGDEPRQDEVELMDPLVGKAQKLLSPVGYFL